ncbi:MAG: chitobiase/beta-hexosaminidase C-terminal domain-containing protein, partial [Terracidiphilus sp.]
VSGAVPSGQLVTITAASGASINYCITATTCTPTTPYTGAITVTSAETIQAIAVETGYVSSTVASASYTLETQLAAPTISPVSGAVPSGQLVTITAASGASINYCITATTCTPTTPYTGAITVTSAETIEAIAVETGYVSSTVASASYTLETQLAAPTISPVSGAVPSGQLVTITAASGASINYCITATTCTPTTPYTGAITVTSAETIQAIAVETGYVSSTVASASYTLETQLAAPTFLPVSGAVPSGQLVTITAASGASINYCITATTCTPTTPYTGAITVTSAETIEAIAVETGYVSSTVASASYTLETQLAAPTISPVSGAVPSGQLVTITAASGASINYCITATTCTPTTPYTGAITVTSAETIEAIAVETGYVSSTVASASYTITGQPQVTFSGSSIIFPTTGATKTSLPSVIEMKNTGNATLTGINISLTGANTTQFSLSTPSTTCGATLAVNAACYIYATFTPAAASPYSASISISDNAANSPQSVSLSGSGTNAGITYAMYSFPQPDASVTPLYTLVNSAQNTIDMTMYELKDTIFSGYLVAACNRGVTVRVILMAGGEKTSNTAAFNQLNAVTHCSAVWANTAFENTHQKTFTIDGTQTAILSLNLVTADYPDTRDFAMVENDPTDIAAIEATFNQDYAAGTTAAGVSGASDFSYSPGAGDDLIWSPTTADPDMLSIINNAQSTLLIENEELSSSASDIVSALVNACQTRGVQVHFVSNIDSSYTAQFNQLTAAGCKVYLYVGTGTLFYVHAKAVVADYGLGTQNAYMGSINYSSASMTQNRELGMFVSDPVSVQLLNTTIASDYLGLGQTYPF